MNIEQSRVIEHMRRRLDYLPILDHSILVSFQLPCPDTEFGFGGGLRGYASTTGLASESNLPWLIGYGIRIESCFVRLRVRPIEHFCREMDSSDTGCTGQSLTECAMAKGTEDGFPLHRVGHCTTVATALEDGLGLSLCCGHGFWIVISTNQINEHRHAEQ